jgi:hypothetical protein
MTQMAKARIRLGVELEQHPKRGLFSQEIVPALGRDSTVRGRTGLCEEKAPRSRRH